MTSRPLLGQLSLCAGSAGERELARPIYHLVERMRWQPGGPTLSLGGS